MLGGQPRSGTASAGASTAAALPRGAVRSAAATAISEKPTATQRASVKPATKASAERKTSLPAKTLARTETPKTPPSSRRVLLVPEATPASETGTEPMIELATVGKQNEVPVPATK